MTRKQRTWRHWAVAAVFGVVFFRFGIDAAVRVVGVLMLISAVRTLKDGRVGFGIKGYEPSFFLTGMGATVFAVVSILLALVLIIHPDWIPVSGLKF